MAGGVQELETPLDYVAILARERANVRHGAQRGDLQQVLGERLPEVGPQRLYQLVGEACAGQPQVRVLRLLPLGVHHRRRIRKTPGQGVVVGDDGVDPQGGSQVHLVDRGGPAVDGDHGCHALGPDAADSQWIQAVAFRAPVRKVRDDLRAQLRQRHRGYSGPSQAVGVEVAIHRYGLPSLDGAAEAVYGLPHVRQQERVVAQPMVGGEERICLRPGANVPVVQEPCVEVREAYRVREAGRRLGPHPPLAGRNGIPCVIALARPGGPGCQARQPRSRPT